jgi:serine phosphatase RsbU (regulator of sigma subunit)/anti-sigma regulatory factor (Ser/Thr protein kinase)
MFRNVKKEEITIPAQMSYLIQIRDFVEHIGKRYKYSEKMINSFKLVIDEACTNIIRHGYRDIKNGEIQIKAIIRRLSLTIVVVDQGTSYDPRQANTPDLAKYVDIGKKGGLGILMMRKLMDDIQYVVSERGNEFRLTKFREATDEPKLMQTWHALNMRTRYSLISSLILTAVVAGIFGMLFIDLRSDVQNEIFNIAGTSTRSLAENSAGGMLTNSDPLGLYENAASVIKSTEIEIYEAFIVNQNKNVVARSTLTRQTELGSKYQLPEDFDIADSLDNAVIYHYELNDSLDIFDVVSDIREPSVVGDGGVLGQAHVWIDSASITNLVNEKRITLIIILIAVLAVGYTGSFYLVSQILKSFHSLADWVRQVVRGKVDQDEIDIDTSDEIGEIAQAFNEMTAKFRDAQVNLMEQQKLQKELQVAQEIQQMLLPSDFPKVDGFDIGSYYEAAKEVGGDLFDFVEVDEDTVGIIVADVSGKGVPGSLIMTMIRTALRLESRGNKNPADVLARVNRFVSDDMRKGMFVTMFYIILDSRNRVIYYASAGHNPMILYRSSSKQTYYLNPSGFPVGIQLPDINLFDKKIETDSIRLLEDDILVLYTDGITEAMNHKRDLYREERFLQSIRDNGHLDVAEFVRTIKDNLKNFTGGAPQNDDITFVAIKEKLMAGEVIFKTHKHVVDLIEDGMRVKDACDKLNISQYQYYKYKAIVDEGGLDSLRSYLDGQDHLEKKHISIEVKAKVFDIIKENPKHGAGKISKLLDTEKYGFIKLDERRIYNELIKLRLNTPHRRQRFAEKGHHNRLKQPGTPLLTLDGKVILDFQSSESEIARRKGYLNTTPQQSSSSMEQSERKPFVRTMSSSKGSDNAKIMHQTGQSFDPAKLEKPDEELKSDKEAEAAQEKEALQNKVKIEKPAEPPKEEKPAEREQISVPTTEELRKKSIEKLDKDLIDKLFFECKDDFSTLNDLSKKYIEKPDSGDELKKMDLIMKIVLKNPILNKLPEVNQLFVQSQALLEYAQRNHDALEKSAIKHSIESVLSYLSKENILSTSESIIENINRVGVIHKNLQISTNLEKSADSDLDKIRSKIAAKHLVKNSSLLDILNENSKK